MQQCAQELKDIRHSESQMRFFRVSGLTRLEELLFNLPEASFPAVIVENNQNGSLGDRSPSDNFIDIPYYEFSVIQRTEFNDHDAIESAKEQCKAIGMKIISRMIRDKRYMANGLTFLDVNSINYLTFGPIADHTFGVSFAFTVRDQADVTYNATDWTT